ncbi:MAG: DUF4145 domain-containing protein [Acidobacteriota bacterium]
MRPPYYPPSFGSQQFNCPRCHVYAPQKFHSLSYQYGEAFSGEVLTASRCGHCRGFSIWLRKSLIDPPHDTIIPPHEDLPESLQADYDEAMSVLRCSPRASAALVRLLLQKLLFCLGEMGRINDAIGSLVEKGLPKEVQQAMDVCRLVGNNAVHPGEINIDDTPEMVEATFWLINFIVEEMISRPKRIQELYSRMPEGGLKAIERRDGSVAVLTGKSEIAGE